MLGQAEAKLGQAEAKLGQSEAKLGQAQSKLRLRFSWKIFQIDDKMN